MAINERHVETHYSVTHLGETILAALRSMGKDIDALAPADLAPVDEFHIRGRESTRQLARLAGVSADMHVLDVGCGLGGSARYLALEHGCRVTGLDLTLEYIHVATMLSNRLGLGGRTVFRHGSALDLPFEDEGFDLAWTEHTQMNVADKARFYREIARVLKAGRRLAFHDIFQGPGGAPHFPAPWAGDASISHLVPADAGARLLDALGFRVVLWEDVTEVSLEWFRKVREDIAAHGPVPLGLHVLMGADARLKFENQIRNLEEGRITVALAVLEKTTSR